MTSASPAVTAAHPTTAYEALRAAALSGHTNGHGGLAIIVHRGLTAWIDHLKANSLPHTPPQPILVQSMHWSEPNSTFTPNELTRALAEIIVTITTGDTATNG